MATVTSDRVAAALVDPETFFERAARGERDAQAVGAPNHAQGAATMPRATRPAPSRRERLSRRQRLESVVPDPRWIGSAALVGTVTAVVLVAAMSGGEETPSRSAAGPTLSGAKPPADMLAPRPGTLTLHAARVRGLVYDPGSGIRRVELVEDGRPVDSRSFPCRRVCPAAARFSLHGSTAPAGAPRAVAVVATDAAGNRALVAQRLVAPRHTRSGATISARVEGSDRSLSIEASYSLAGRLTDRHGEPIPGARIEVVGVSATATSIPARAATATTDERGRWRVVDIPARDGSRLYVARQLRPAGAVSRTVTVRVEAGLAAHGRRLSSGHRIVAGRVAHVAPNVAVRVVIGTRRAGRWRGERTADTQRGGRFELHVPARVHGRVAVFVADPDLPYAPAGRVVRFARP